MTNRDKINKMTNEELARRQSNSQKDRGVKAMEINNLEEEKIPYTLTKKSVNEIYSRLKKLEDTNKILRNIMQGMIDANKTLCDVMMDIVEKLEETNNKKLVIELKKEWIVHRTLRRNGKETYISEFDKTQQYLEYIYDGQTYNEWVSENKENAVKFYKEDAIKLRDRLNQSRQGKRYLWVVSKEAK